MRRAMRLYLPYEAWSKQARSRWQTAFRSGTDPFDDRGPGSHLAERTQAQLRYSYGKFLAFLSARHRRLLGRSPVEQFNRTTIEEYARWQPATCGPVTLALYLYHLWMAVRCLCPHENWSWLLSISRRIAVQAKRKRPRHHLVTSETLYALGIELMDGALNTGKPTVTRHMQTAYRDGLAIALLALIPLRRRTVAALQIGKHLVRSGDLWALDIPAADVKTKRPLEFPLGPELSDRIDIYLSEIRCRIPAAETHKYLWASSKGPMSDKMIYKGVRRRTWRVLGFPVNLHRFRSAAATLWAVVDPMNVRGAKDLLGHASFASTEGHYIMAQSRCAGRILAKAINELASVERRSS
jgi:integrase/recombinase XerD